MRRLKYFRRGRQKKMPGVVSRDHQMLPRGRPLVLSLVLVALATAAPAGFTTFFQVCAPLFFCF
jgi:hypothetical protein